MSHTAHAPLLSLVTSVRTARSQPVPPVVTVSPLSLQERAAVLDAEVSRARGNGAEPESHSATVAVLVYPGGAPNHVAALLLSFLRLRLGLFTRAAAPESTKTSRVMLTVNECGDVTRWVLPR